MANLTNRNVIENMLKYIKQAEHTMERFDCNYETFQNDDVYYNALSMAIFQAAEISLNLGEDLKNAVQTIPWQAIRGMRKWFAHSYGAMNPTDMGSGNK